MVLMMQRYGLSHRGVFCRYLYLPYSSTSSESNHKKFSRILVALCISIKVITRARLMLVLLPKRRGRMEWMTEARARFDE